MIVSINYIERQKNEKKHSIGSISRISTISDASFGCSQHVRLGHSDGGQQHNSGGIVLSGILAQHNAIELYSSELIKPYLVQGLFQRLD